MTKSSGSQGFKLPVNIPDAPETVVIGDAVSSSIELFKGGVDVLMRKPGAYEREMGRATWWNFWLLATVGAIVVAIATALTSVLVQSRPIFGIQLQPNYGGIILQLILLVPVTLAVLYAAAYVSHWFATTQRSGQGSLVGHAYTIAVVLVPANVIGTVVTLVLSVINLGGLAALISLIVSIVALVITVDGFQMLHKIDRNSAWMTAVVGIVTSFVVTLVLGGIVAGLALPR